ncbi:MAG: hypothetical protein JWN70_7132 [Planctomycetaceae bacterium]|nr:hypothetical protein [Planctomycetaceae bacterium]
MKAQRKPRGRLTWPVVGLVLLVAYLLSFGPVSSLLIWHLRADSIWRKVLLVAYYPIEYACLRVPMLNDLAEWYLSFWI